MRNLCLVSVIFFAIIMLSFSAIDKDILQKNQENTALPNNVETDTIPKKKNIVTVDLKRLMPDIPPSFSSSDSTRFIANWTLGMKFYKANCSSCHGIFGKGKDSIPNFSKEQMDDYKSAYLAGDKLNHGVMARMNEDELSAVFLFLTNIRRK